MAVNSSHLSPGLFFNCSALPAGSSLLRSSAALFSDAFHEYHFAKTTAQSLLPEITRHHLTGMETQALFPTLGFLNFSNLTHKFELLSLPCLPVLIRQNVLQAFESGCQGEEIRSATGDHVGGPPKP